MNHNVLRLLAAAVLFAASGPALAQDTVNQIDRWTGAYVGVALGAGHLSTDQYSPAQLTAPGYDAASYSGWHPYASIQAGADLQLGQTVLGVKLQHAMTNSDGDSFMKVDELVSANAASLTTLTARLGYLLQPDLLGYVSASAVAGQFNYASVDERWNLVDDSLDVTRFGWGIGAGVEYLLDEHVSAFAEASYVDFGTASSTFDYGDSAYPPEWTYEYTHGLGMVQAGLNFRF